MVVSILMEYLYLDLICNWLIRSMIGQNYKGQLNIRLIEYIDQNIKKYFYYFSRPISIIWLRLSDQAILAKVENRIIRIQIRIETMQKIGSNCWGFCIDCLTQNIVPMASNEQTAIPRKPARLASSNKLCWFVWMSVVDIS